MRIPAVPWNSSQVTSDAIVLCHHVLVDSVWGILYGARASFFGFAFGSMLASKTALKNAFEAMGVGMASALTGDLAWAIVAIARCVWYFDDIHMDRGQSESCCACLLDKFLLIFVHVFLSKPRFAFWLANLYFGDTNLQNQRRFSSLWTRRVWSMDLNQWVPIWMLVPQLDELSRLSARCLKSWHSLTDCHYTHLHTVKVYAFFPRNSCMALWGGIAQTVRPPWNVFGRTQHAEVQRCEVCISFPRRCAGASRTCTGMHVGKLQPQAQPQPPSCGATFWQECHYLWNNVQVDRNERILTPEPF